MADIKPTSPAAGRAPLDGRITLRELAWRGKVNLRGDGGDAQFTGAVNEVFGMPLPLDANTTSAHGDDLIFWLGPNEWLVHCDIHRVEDFISQLKAQLAGVHHAVTEVSDYFTVLQLTGDDSANILARGCPLDLHERAFKAGQCAQTRFGNASVLLYKPDAAPAFLIQVRWSFAGYVWDYLTAVVKTLCDAS